MQADPQLFDKYGARVYGLCRKFTNDVNQAQDYLQDCFLHIYENIHKYDAEKGNLDAWIYRVANNVILKTLEKNKRLPIAELNDFDLAEERNTEEERIDPAILYACLDQLPLGYKEVLRMYILENKSHKEIAIILNITESTSRSQLLRAKQYLKKLLINSTYERG